MPTSEFILSSLKSLFKILDSFQNLLRAREPSLRLHSLRQAKLKTAPPNYPRGTASAAVLVTLDTALGSESMAPSSVYHLKKLMNLDLEALEVFNM